LGNPQLIRCKNVLLVDATLTILFLSATQHGSRHDKRIADATPYPLPRGSHLLQDLGFQAFSLEGVTAHTPHKKPRGGLLTEEQKESNRHLARRRIRIEHVNSSVKRCRIAKDTIRLMRAGVRDSVIEIGSGPHSVLRFPLVCQGQLSSLLRAGQRTAKQPSCTLPASGQQPEAPATRQHGMWARAVLVDV